MYKKFSVIFLSLCVAAAMIFGAIACCNNEAVTLCDMDAEEMLLCDMDAEEMLLCDMDAEEMLF